MADDTVNIEVDGKPFQARKGQMLIQVTDAQDIYVPRFCYHKKLSVAANCRMCLVEVEKAPKPLPACATPVMDGMKVHTRSKLALEAQKSVMEFLLINHPLDCPICDQGGECELQDLAMGYGRDVSRFQEGKRVVKDKNIGPLVQTDMTRCIHCTRCVRFGDEIAGVRELGATGRGEFMEIGTYVEKAMVSELSGNVIDLCPVGALTSKPFRFSARAWEMTQAPGIAPHDGVGSNVHFHIKDGRVKRVVPAENEAVNEVWLSDRDRYSYEGLYSPERLTAPMVRQGGTWQEVDWDTALDAARAGLAPLASGGRVGGLISPTASTEELFLFQKLLRGLGSGHVDHRLQHQDFSDQDVAPRFPSLGMPIRDVENLKATLIIGGHPRKEQPLLNHRLRKAALRGAQIMFVNAVDAPMNYRTGPGIVSGARLVQDVAAILKVMTGDGGGSELRSLLSGVQAGDAHREIARRLMDDKPGGIFLGNAAMAMSDAAVLRFLAAAIAGACGATLGFLGDAANSAGAWLAGAVPHRGAGGEPAARPGMHSRAMLEAGLPGYLLFNVEVDADCADAPLALNAMASASCVVSLSAFRNAATDRFAHVQLPIAVYAENEGSYVSVEGRSQAFTACVRPPGETRPGWKVLRVLADCLGIGGLAYDRLADIEKDLAGLVPGTPATNTAPWPRPQRLPEAAEGLQRITLVPMNAADPLVRHAAALQQTGDTGDGTVHVSAGTARRLGLGTGRRAICAQNGNSATLQVTVDERVPDGVALIHGGQPGTAALGPWFGEISLRSA